MVKLHFKTELCDGEFHFPPGGFLEHQVEERRWKQIQELKKIANNPILTEEVRHIIQMAIVDTNMAFYWRKAYIELREKYEGKGE